MAGGRPRWRWRWPGRPLPDGQPDSGRRLRPPGREVRGIGHHLRREGGKIPVRTAQAFPEFLVPPPKGDRAGPPARWKRRPADECGDHSDPPQPDRIDDGRAGGCATGVPGAPVGLRSGRRPSSAGAPGAERRTALPIRRY